jgi:hypothetical protein
LALRGVGPESEVESVRFHGRRVTKVGPEVKHGRFRVAGRARNPKKLPPEGWGPLNKGCERRTRALPDVSGERQKVEGISHTRHRAERSVRIGGGTLSFADAAPGRLDPRLLDALRIRS